MTTQAVQSKNWFNALNILFILIGASMLMILETTNDMLSHAFPMPEDFGPGIRSFYTWISAMPFGIYLVILGAASLIEMHKNKGVLGFTRVKGALLFTIGFSLFLTLPFFFTDVITGNMDDTAAFWFSMIEVGLSLIVITVAAFRVKLYKQFQNALTAEASESSDGTIDTNKP